MPATTTQTTTQAAPLTAWTGDQRINAAAATPAARAFLRARLLRQVEYDTNGGCWLWSGAARNGTIRYGRVVIPGHPSGASTHRVSYAAFHGPFDPSMHVLHRCDVPQCINPNHLFLGTNAENIADRMAKGRSRKLDPAQTPSAKLTWEQADAIRESTRTDAELAAQYGIGRLTVQRIRNGQAWVRPTAFTTHGELTADQRERFGDYVAAKDAFRARCEYRAAEEARIDAAIKATAGDPARALALLLEGL